MIAKRALAKPAGWVVVVAGLLSGCGESSAPGPRLADGTPLLPPPAVRFVGFDGSPPLVAALRKGQLQGVVLQNPYRMGQLGVKTLVDHLDKKEVPRQVSTGETLATPENMNTPEVEALLNPPKEEHS